MTEVNRNLNMLLVRIATRAERHPRDVLARSFVVVREIEQGLERIDHQIMYGRRGTGKTHALNALAARLDGRDDLPVYLDLRTIGSSGGIYADSGEDLSLRGTRLLLDVLEATHGQLLGAAVNDARFEGLLGCLDDLVDASTEVQVKGPVTTLDEKEDEDQSDRSAQWELDAKWTGGASIAARSAKDRRKRHASKRSTQRTGSELPQVAFGRLRNALATLTAAIAPKRIWLLMDEWSCLPLDLQPVLADLLRRSFMPCPGVTVKICAIERRSRFIQRDAANSYIGLELGADTSAALNLDEYLLATEAGGRAEAFFATLLLKHLSVLYDDLELPSPFADPQQLVKTGFAPDAFREFVRAAEGVPRDALHIAGLAASRAGDRAITAADVQGAAHKYYLQDKEAGISGNREAQEHWNRLQREVVGLRQSRTFLLRRNVDYTHPAILDLYDARLIHLLRPGLTTAGWPGVAFDGYSVDYGSYVAMLNQTELNGAWDSRERPWTYDGRDAILPDRFDRDVIFTPAQSRAPEAQQESTRFEAAR